METLLALLFPVLLQLMLSEGVSFITGNSLDAVQKVLLTSLLVLPAAILLLQKDRRETNFRSLRKRNLLKAVLCLFGGAALNFMISSSWNLLPWVNKLENETQEALLGGNLVLQGIAMGVLVPITEEMIYRGLFYQRLRHLIPTAWAMFFSAALFALGHGNLRQALYAFPMGILLCLLYEKEQDLLYPVLLHAGSNLIAILWLS